MIEGFGLSVAVYAVAVAAACAWAMARDEERSSTLAAAVLVVQCSAVVQCLIDLATLAGGATTPEPTVHAVYLVLSILIVPAFAVTSRFDRRRVGNAGLAVGCLTLAIISVRLHLTVVPAPRST